MNIKHILEPRDHWEILTFFGINFKSQGENEMIYCNVPFIFKVTIRML